MNSIWNNLALGLKQGSDLAPETKFTIKFDSTSTSRNVQPSAETKPKEFVPIYDRYMKQSKDNSADAKDEGEQRVAAAADNTRYSPAPRSASRERIERYDDIKNRRSPPRRSPSPRRKIDDREFKRQDEFRHRSPEPPATQYRGYGRDSREYPKQAETTNYRDYDSRYRRDDDVPARRPQDAKGRDYEPVSHRRQEDYYRDRRDREPAPRDYPRADAPSRQRGARSPSPAARNASRREYDDATRSPASTKPETKTELSLEDYVRRESSQAQPDREPQPEAQPSPRGEEPAEQAAAERQRPIIRDGRQFNRGRADYARSRDTRDSYPAQRRDDRFEQRGPGGYDRRRDSFPPRRDERDSYKGRDDYRGGAVQDRGNSGRSAYGRGGSRSRSPPPRRSRSKSPPARDAASRSRSRSRDFSQSVSPKRAFPARKGSRSPAASRSVSRSPIRDRSRSRSPRKSRSPRYGM